MTGDRSTDRRVQRTRRALHEALLELMMERGWDDISVQDLCDRADIGRSTFYMHFSSKEKLLVSGFDDLRRELRKRQATVDEKGADALPFARGMIEHFYDNQSVFRAVVGKRSGYVVQRRFRELVIGMVKEDLARVAPAGWQLDATVHYLAGAFVELFSWALQTHPAHPRDEVERFLRRLTNPVIAQLRAMK